MAGDELWKYLPDYRSWTWQVYFYYALFGMMGGLLRVIHAQSGIGLPSRTEDGFLRLNAVGTVMSAMMLGMLTNHNPLLATLSGVVATEIVELVINLGVTMVKVMGGRGFRILFLQWLKGQIPDDGDRDDGI